MDANASKAHLYERAKQLDVEGRSKMNKDELRIFRDRLYMEDQVPDEALDTDMPPYYRPPEDHCGPQYSSTCPRI